MKTIFLLPPSEGKNSGGNFSEENASFKFSKPTKIANNTTEKDLKCKGKRYEEGMTLNKNIALGPFEYGINRYTGVTYNAIDYPNMTDNGKQFFENNYFNLFYKFYLTKVL